MTLLDFMDFAIAARPEDGATPGQMWSHYMRLLRVLAKDADLATAAAATVCFSPRALREDARYCAARARFDRAVSKFLRAS
jgi:hypothetical protein